MQDEEGGEAKVERGQVGLEWNRGEARCGTEEGRLGLQSKP